MKKILIISSEYTGHGHKSVSTALKESFSYYYKDEVRVSVINGFVFTGLLPSKFERLYNPCVRYAPHVWDKIFRLSSEKPSYINKYSKKMIKRAFLKLINKYNPDAIVSVHPGFVGNILNILSENNKTNIKFYVLITDLISISNIWIDSRVCMTISPSEEATDYVMKSGLSNDKVVTLGLPVRNGFFMDYKSEEEVTENTNLSQPLKILLLNNFEKRKKLEYILNNLLNRYDCTVTLICGRSKKAYSTMKQIFDDNDRVHIHGYSHDLPFHFKSNDILITKCGAASIMEAVNSMIPIVSMGALPGQEEETPYFIEKNGLGFSTNSTNDIFNKIDLFTQNNREKLLSTRLNQFRYKGRNVEKSIVDLILQNTCS